MARNRCKIGQKPVSSGIDEDFGSILTTMLGICTLLEEKRGDDPELSRYLRLLRSSVERAVSLVGRR